MSTAKEIVSSAKTRMDKVLADLQHEMAAIRTGRATVAVFDNIKVDYYGTPTPIPQMANVSVPEPRMITVKPWDKGTLKAIEKAIRESDLGLNPASQGDLLRIPMPMLTEERRREIVKVVRQQAETGRVAVRTARREALAGNIERDRRSRSDHFGPGKLVYQHHSKSSR